MRGEPRQEIGGQGQGPSEKDVLHGDVIHVLGLLLLLPVGVRITRGGITQLVSSAKSIQVGRRGGGSASGGLKS